MKAIQRPDQYLRRRGDIWHYVRRVPKSVRHVDSRSIIYRSLDTDSPRLARQRRDVCANADDQRWNEISPSKFSLSSRDAGYRDASQTCAVSGLSLHTYGKLSDVSAYETDLSLG
jgi:hypothetical protein